MSGQISLGPGAEFDAIREMLCRWGPRAVGIGDDAAVVAPSRGNSLVASVDAMVEGRHFKNGWLTPREIGYRAVAAALSDLAAMAARPIGILVAIVAPTAWHSRLSDLADGIGEMLDVADTVIRGGNLSAGDEFSMTTTALGECFAPLTRSGAAPGDHVYVTGRLGAPATAVARLYAGEEPGEFRERFARPTPRLRESIWLADHGASSAIDISDGLLADAAHLAAAAARGIDLDVSRVPIFSGADVQTALTGGEEYELIVTTAATFDVAAFEQRFSLPLTRIGAITGDADAVLLNGTRVANMRGHDHFSR